MQDTKKTKKTYALKKLSKGFIVKTNMEKMPPQTLKTYGTSWKAYEEWHCRVTKEPVPRCQSSQLEHPCTAWTYP